jgi:hypothetical protein
VKRNWDTIRELLVKVEACTLPAETVTLHQFDAERHPEVSYHMALLIEAGLVHGQMSRSIGPSVKNFMAQRLTWQGHELLDTIRNDTIWSKTKKMFLEKGVEMSFDLVKSAAAGLMAAALST